MLFKREKLNPGLYLIQLKMLILAICMYILKILSMLILLEQLPLLLMLTNMLKVNLFFILLDIKYN